jgi:hypothetical protein
MKATGKVGGLDPGLQQRQVQQSPRPSEMRWELYAI